MTGSSCISSSIAGRCTARWRWCKVSRVCICWRFLWGVHADYCSLFYMPPAPAWKDTELATIAPPPPSQPAAAAAAAAALPDEGRQAGARDHLVYIGPYNSLASHKVTKSCSYWTKQLLPLKKWTTTTASLILRFVPLGKISRACL
ncbi:hypothetical protein PF008_g24665 [Phytophthora fragariae]|uniref:Uncharacterized protein n=1 Tax=Phytophthora fragariae TaxID=53985 RepID=A0A6G0QMD0_9STRA|nr:hypothetical protein PF008_g24665 [Phytophthora fragariae]